MHHEPSRHRQYHPGSEECFATHNLAVSKPLDIPIQADFRELDCRVPNTQQKQGFPHAARAARLKAPESFEFNFHARPAVKMSARCFSSNRLPAFTTPSILRPAWNCLTRDFSILRTATTPPQVVAARKSTQPVGRLVRYVVTTAGPEPIDNIQHPLDREHYVLKQVKPVAEPVLETLGLDFERVIGDSRQIDLYSMLGEV